MTPITLDIAAQALAAIDAGVERETWVQLGMALKSEFGDEAFDTWDSWSSRSNAYKQAEVRSVWKSFKSGNVGIGTLVYLAKLNGFVFPREELSADEREQRERDAQRRKRKAQQRERIQADKDRKRATRAAKEARKWWARMARSGVSAYLNHKQVQAYGLRFKPDGTAVLPVCDVRDDIHGLQVLYANGDKRFWPAGMRKSGNFYLIGNKPGLGDVVVVCEGYATGASIHEATGLPVFVVFDAGNLGVVTKKVRAAFPDCRIIVAADDDYLTDGNPGVSAARKAAKKVDGAVAVPHFSVDRDGRKWTDFNDLHVLEGLDVVRSQIDGARAFFERDHNTSPDDSAVDDGYGAHGNPDPDDWSFSPGKLVRWFTFIYGTEKQLAFDGVRHKLVPLSSIKTAAGKAVVEQWLSMPERKTVDWDNVVFDPACEVNPVTHVNLFRGWPIKPGRGDCDRLLELLLYLCNDDGDVFDWILRWAAFPLQNPGAKMRTAVLMHGGEGTGKNTFWEAVRRIYGHYSTIITQTELEGQFNGWSSAKLFVIGNEVVSRQEMYHQKGRIKNMITEPFWSVNEKNIPIRLEANHANFVFLSNHVQPMTPDQGDRRLCVIWTPPKKPDDYYKGFDDYIDSGGAEALYHMLMSMDLTGFNEHSKPPMTEAKQDLISASMDSYALFFREWSDGALPIQYLPCRTDRLYEAYRRWCGEAGERGIVKRETFSTAIGKRILRKRKWVKETGDRDRQKTLFLPPYELTEGQVEKDWLSDCLIKFDNAMEVWAPTKAA